jgi:hypothetical protein
LTDKELWEWYAGQALSGMLASGDDFNSETKTSFVLANRMMEERARLLQDRAIPWEE